MNKNMMWIAVIVALFVGAFAGYSFEKSRATTKMEGMKMDMQKQIDDAKMTAKDKTMDGGKDEAAMMKKENMTGVTLKGGKMMTIWKDGSLAAMTEDVTLADGTKVMTDGTVIHKDGSKTTLKEGETLEMSGVMMEK